MKDARFTVAIVAAPLFHYWPQPGGWAIST